MIFFSKKENHISRVTPGYEETERQTPKTGYILLLAMFVAALFFGWRAIDDLQNVPTVPESLSFCASPFLTYSWEDSWRGHHGYYYLPSYERSSYTSERNPYTNQAQGCVFSSYEKKYGVPAVFEKRKQLDEALGASIQAFDNAANQLSEQERQYNLGLQEKIAREEKQLYPLPATKESIENLRLQKAELETKIAKLKSELQPYDEQLKTLYQNVMRDYRRAWRWYEFKVFLLEALFVFPFFLFVFWLYRKLLSKNSPYTIIATALVGVASVLMLRILLVWFWSLFLARIIQTIWEYIQNFAFLRSLVFYGGMVLSIVVFGGAVYLLQKRIFDPRRVAIRRLRDKQCPHCQTSLDLAVGFCPNCGRKLKETCSKCGKERWADFPACPHCGFKHESL